MNIMLRVILMADEVQEDIRQMADYFDIEKTEMMKSREYPLPVCRALLYRKYRDMGFSFLQLQGLFGKDHSTIINQLKRLQGYEEIGDQSLEEYKKRFNTILHGTDE